MNICFVTEEFPPETGWGGIGSYFWEVSHGLASLGHRVDVITYGREMGVKNIHEKLYVHKINTRKITPFSSELINAFNCFSRRICVGTLKRLQWSMAAARYFRRLQATAKSDLLEFSEAYGAGFFFRSFEIPTVVKLHLPLKMASILCGHDDRIDYHLQDIIEKYVTHSASAVIGCSKAILEEVDSTWGLDGQETFVINNPIDNDFFNPLCSSQKNSNRYEKKKLTIGYFGRIDSGKGVDVLYEAFKEAANTAEKTIELVFVGQDRSRPHYQQTWSEYLMECARNDGLSEHIKFLGYYPRNELPLMYSSFDICVVPSKKFENFPYACLEPMSCGRAVVASRCGGIPEMIEDGISGLLVKPGNSSSLARALVKLIENGNLRKSLGRNARQRVENLYSRTYIAKKTLQLYKKVLQESHSPTGRPHESF
ncbi:MAG: glycosyltransferase family 1 protein [Candidatus Electrothrix sp. AR4]|nr:glycosyltransferase family 1 protein [Candidatus Electrothrix sp. AR4]